MKIIYILLLFFNIVLLNAQTFKQIDQFSNGLGETFIKFESANHLKPEGKNRKFGLESRSYVLKNFSIMISEIEEGKIGEIFYLLNNSKNNSEKWYNLVKEFDGDPNYEFISSYVADPSDKITTDKLNFNELISLLRKSSHTDDFIYEVQYKKGNGYIKVGYIASIISITQSLNPIN